MWIGEMKSCELCKERARVHCAADQASLCWDCDARVHSANFLVARHSRTLLCRACQGPTPWSAAGAKLGPTAASACQRCGADGRTGGEEPVEENQVVPWSSSPPPPVESSSSVEEAASGGEETAISGKRSRTGRYAFDEDEISSFTPARAASGHRRETLRKNRRRNPGRV